MNREDALYKAAARAANAYYRTFLQNASYADLENAHQVLEFLIFMEHWGAIIHQVFGLAAR